MERIKLVDFLKFKKEDLIGKVICFPTDTVYGMGAMINDFEAIEKIFQIKGRDFIKPLANLIGNVDDIDEFVINRSNFVNDIIKTYWPGPLTIIFNKRKEVNIKNNFNTISFRMPNSLISLSILKQFGPFATTSVNKSGGRELSNILDIESEFKDDINYIIVDKATLSKVPSTVIDITNDTIEVIRKGVISFE